MIKFFKRLILVALIVLTFAVLFKAYKYFDRGPDTVEKLTVNEIISKLMQMKSQIQTAPSITDESGDSNIVDNEFITAAAGIIADGSFLKNMSSSDMAAALGIIGKIDPNDFNDLLLIMQAKNFNQDSSLEVIRIFSDNLSSDDIDKLFDIIGSNTELLKLLRDSKN